MASNDVYNKSLEEFLRKNGYDETTIQLKVRDAERQRQRQSAADQRLQEEKDAWIDFGEEGAYQRYNPLTEAYTLRGEMGDIFSRGKNAEGQAFANLYGSNIAGSVWDPTKAYGQGEQYLGYNDIDPRVAAQIQESDYASADEQLKSYSDRLSQWYDQRKNELEGKLDTSGDWQNQVMKYGTAGALALATGANPFAGLTFSMMMQNEADRKEGMNLSSGGQYGSFFSPNEMPEDLRNIFNFVQNQKNIDTWAQQQAYLNAQERLGPMEGNFYSDLQSQAAQLQQQQSASNKSINTAFLSNPNLSDAVKKSILQDAISKGGIVDSSVLDQYGLGSMSQDPMTQAYTQMSSSPVTKTPQPSAPATPQQPMQAGDVTNYAESMASDKSTPWSADFEKQFLQQMSGYGDMFQTYLSSLQGNQGKAQSPKFSLKGYSQSTTMNANTPVSGTAMQGSYTGVAPAQSSTGKAGQTNTNNTLWR